MDFVDVHEFIDIQFSAESAVENWKSLAFKEASDLHVLQITLSLRSALYL
jgi:hypothetical protein